MSEDLIDSDIRVAKTLPSKFYTSEKRFRKLLKAFKTSWQFVGSSQEFTSAISPLKDLEKILGEPLIRVQDGESTQLLSNVCTHRGMILCQEHSDAKTIQCPYHGRTFNRDGSLKHMPGFDDVVDFPSISDHLQSFELHTWNGFEFASMNPNVHLEEVLRPVQERLGWFFSDLKYDPARDRDWEIDANWMLYVDNYLEGFHIPFVHPELNEALDKNGYSTECFEHGVLQIGTAQDGDVCFEIPHDSIDYGKNIAAYYWWIFPNLMLNVYPWGISVNIVIPTGVDSTSVLFRSYVKRPDLLDKGAGAALDKVELQDQFVVENCMKGLRSESYKRGRYSPSHEQGVHHFHRIITNQR
jgi:choline monooxygenase